MRFLSKLPWLDKVGSVFRMTLSRAGSDFVEAPWPICFAFTVLVLTMILIKLSWGTPALVVLIIFVGNSAAQMCIDYIKTDSKPFFSALARLIPIVIAICAYLVAHGSLGNK